MCQVGSSYVYGSSSAGQPEMPASAGGGSADPYHDPYDKLSGYAKQKGYPPQTNTPGSSKYNPYKVKNKQQYLNPEHTNEIAFISCIHYCIFAVVQYFRPAYVLYGRDTGPGFR
jgi:hypothetical protein